MPDRPHPEDPGFVEAYSRAWSDDVSALLDFFAADGAYADMAMGTTYTGHEQIARLSRHRDYWDVATLLTQAGVPLGA